MAAEGKFWQRRFYWLLGLLIVLNIGYVIVGHYASQDLDILQLDTDGIVTALKNDEIDKVSFFQETETLDGTFKSQFEKKWGHRRFTYTGKLGAGLYEQIIDKNLSTNLSLGAAAGFDKNQEFEERAAFHDVNEPLNSSVFKIGEKSVFGLDFMGLEAGELVIEVLSLKSVAGERAIEFGLRVKSRPGFKVYSLDDKVTIWVGPKNLNVIAAKIVFEEAGRYGGVFNIFDEKNRIITEWQNYVEKSRGRHKSNETYQIMDKAESPFGAIFKLRGHRFKVGQEYSFIVQDHEKKSEVLAKAVRQEVVETAVGSKKSLLIECEVRSLEKKNDPPTKLAVWLSDDDRQYILKINVDLKFGKISAKLRDLNAGT